MVGICEEDEGDGLLVNPSVELVVVCSNNGAAIGPALNMVGLKVGGIGV